MAGAYRVNTWSTLRGLSKVKAHLTAHDVGFNIPRNGGHDAFAACIDLDDGNYAPHVQSPAPEGGNQAKSRTPSGEQSASENIAPKAREIGSVLGLILIRSLSKTVF